MKGWPTKPLGDLVSLEYGKALKAEQRSEDGRYPVYGSNGVVGSHHEAVVKEPTIVVGRKGAIGEAHLAENGCWPIDTAFYTQFRLAGIVTLQYLLLWFHSVDLKSLAITATIPGLNRNTLYAQQVPVPPLAEQMRIVKLLDEANELQKLRGQADSRTAALIPALFHEMFGDPATNSKGWPLQPVSELIEACDYGTSQKASEEGRGLPVLRMGNVTIGGLLDLDDLKTIELTENELRKQRLQAGDVLFNRTNSRELVGKTGMWDGRFEAVAASYFIRVRFRSDIEHPQHFTTFMNLPFMKGRLAEMARGAVGQANINSQELKSIQVPVPPMPLQKEFAQRVADIRELDATQTGSRQGLEALFQSMLHRAFNREL